MVDRCRIFYLIESLGLGGAEKRLLIDMENLDRSRFEPVVCFLTKEDDLKKDFERLGVSTVGMSASHPSDGARIVSGLVRLIRRYRPHILHTQLFWADLYGRLAGRFSRTPLAISTVQSTVYDNRHLSLYSQKRLWLDRWSARWCQHFVAVSETVRDSIMRHLRVDPGQISVIYNAIGEEAFSTMPEEERRRHRAAWGLRGDAFLFVTVGKLHPDKGHPFLIRAFAGVFRRHPHVRLWIVGEGSFRKTLEDLVQSLGLQNAVSFLGRRLDVKNLLSACDGFVFPTLSEGMPFCLLEAMASGRPVLATNIGPNQEAIQDGQTGFLVPPGDSHALEAKLEMMLSHPDQLQRMAQEGRSYVQRKFSALQAARRLESLYETLRNGKRHRWEPSSLKEAKTFEEEAATVGTKP